MSVRDTYGASPWRMHNMKWAIIRLCYFSVKWDTFNSNFIDKENEMQKAQLT